MGIIVVEICTNNWLAGYHLEELELKYPEVAVLRTECLGFCGLCKMRPYAIVNGKRISGKTIEECVELIKAAIEAELAALNEV
ncbi:DUF1450 domain-containing protein [Paenibacillus marinisediminis]